MLHHKKRGFALILVGFLFIWITHTSGRSSIVGLVAGLMMIVLGLVRIWQDRSMPPR